MVVSVITLDCLCDTDKNVSVKSEDQNGKMDYSVELEQSTRN